MKIYSLLLILSFWSLSSGAALPDLSVAETLKIQRIVLTSEQREALPLEVRTNLQAAAFNLAQIWGDTILEGDYQAEDEVQLEQVEKLYLSLAFVAYRITYSSVAWDTVSNQKGRIIESGIVSKDFQQISRDSTAFARFIEDEP